MKKDIIVIVGPTGVGKTKVSIELAKRLDAEIINGDSVSIYKRLNIGSAKPTIEEREGIIHHLIDIKDIDEEYSVYDYQQDGRKIIDELENNNKQIIIVGGTGLYIKALLYDYRFTEGTKYDEYNDLSNEEILTKINEFNQDINIHPNNRQRLVRTLNKIENNEEINSNKDQALYNIKVIGLTTNRDLLYERINKRVEIMFTNGLLEEVNSLKEYYSKSKILNNAIGYKEFVPYFNNECSLDEVKEEIKKNSRHYAKRQYTFFNNQFNTNWYDVNFNDINTTIEEIYCDIIK